MIGLRIALGILEAGLYPSVVYLLATWYSRCKPLKTLELDFWSSDVLLPLTMIYRRCGQAILRILCDWLSRSRLWGCPGLWINADERPPRHERLAMDIYHGGCCKLVLLIGDQKRQVKLILSLKFTCICSFFAYFLLVDFPDKADQSWRFLNTDERDFIVRRINKDRDDAIPEKFTLARFLRPALDIKIWILAFISLYVLPATVTIVLLLLTYHHLKSLIITVTTSISVFLPIILRNGMGFTIAESQCLIAPPVRPMSNPSH